MEQETQLTEHLDKINDVITNFLNTFIANNASANLEQGIKLAILIAFLGLFLAVIYLAIKLIRDVARPMIERLGSQPEYLFFSIIAVLIFTNIDNISFGGACTALIIMLVISQSYQITKMILEYKAKARERIQ